MPSRRVFFVQQLLFPGLGRPIEPEAFADKYFHCIKQDIIGYITYSTV